MHLHCTDLLHHVHFKSGPENINLIFYLVLLLVLEELYVGLDELLELLPIVMHLFIWLAGATTYADTSEGVVIVEEQILCTMTACDCGRWVEGLFSWYHINLFHVLTLLSCCCCCCIFNIETFIDIIVMIFTFCFEI